MKQKMWNMKDQADFLTRLGTLLGQGYSLNQALRFLIYQVDENNRSVIYNAIGQLNAGEKLYSVLNASRFMPVCVSFTYFGEKNGDLQKSLITAGSLLKKQLNNRQQVRKLLSYPLFLLSFTFILFAIMQSNILPQFLHLYDSFQVEPNLLIRMLNSLNEYRTFYLLLLCCFMLMIVIFYRLFLNKVQPHERMCLYSRLPIIGKIIKLWNTYYSAFHLSQLLQAGISLNESLQLLGNDPQKKFLNTACQIVQKRLLEGVDFSRAVTVIPYWNEELSFIIQHGQMTGRLAGELETYSTYCLEEFSEQIEKIIKILQPFIFLIIGIWIITLYISLLLPTFQMINNM
ncbi:competence type IV pilus assembly protein ComGB [Bacillus kwashiorkori]|uniref:competence type IV pilus assembly protein ComGB n=1 Tax=Bacillus kwashiorkori TaxID=1522318 RepID=UPI00131A41C8|nr:competence type IV pilus assembly protein ComGB [Bacillus kwashiorkori]